MASGTYILVQAVTAARIPIATCAAVLLARTPPASLGAWTVLLLICLLEASDTADGILARRTGMESRFGRLLDPYCDAISRLIIFYGLGIVGLVPRWLVLLMAIRDISVSYLRLSYLIKGMRVGARLSGKMKAAAQGAVAIVLAFLHAHGGFSETVVEILKVIGLIAVLAAMAWTLVDYSIASITTDSGKTGQDSSGA